ncbi:hypothetical protein ACH4CD_25500 [Streptomyces fungicidicus]|uniref:hypothetical protein n=1 Tax=Streptomyces fungicidicus TaxID=68203 RepID=UPI0037988E42
MTDLIGRLVTEVRVLFRPRGAHRRTGHRPPLPAITPPGQSVATGLRLPSHRSPYGLPRVLDGAQTVAVRPYVIAPWFQERQAA